MLKVKIAKQITTQKDRKVEAAVIDFIETKKEIDVLNEKLKSSKDIIIEKAKEILGDSETSTITLGVDDDNLKVSFGFDIKVENDGVLKELLADRFDDLVETVTTLKLRDKLKKMALGDDGLKECLSIKEKTPTVAVVK